MPVKTCRTQCGPNHQWLLYICCVIIHSPEALKHALSPNVVVDRTEALLFYHVNRATVG